MSGEGAAHPADGALADAIQAVPFQPPGPHRSRPARIRITGVDPTGRWVMVPDKGLDRVFVCFSGDRKLAPSDQGAVTARAGSARGMRRSIRLPVAWVVNEIASTITTYAWDGERGSLRPAQILPTLPSDYTRESTAAEIAVSADGRFVYCSNRGHDSIATFTSDPKTGLLTAAAWTPSQGRTPRYIGFDPSFSLLCATNEQSDTVVTYRADAATGRLAAAGQPVQNASPVSVAFATGS
jgi:6-phosphogluconolactonase (cycloisomerase 2 family)